MVNEATFLQTSCCQTATQHLDSPTAAHFSLPVQDPNPTTAAVASSLTWNAGYRVFAHPTIATTSVLSQVLGPFVFAACMFSFITQV